MKPACLARVLLVLSALSWLSPQTARAAACPALTRVGFSDLGYSSYQEQGKVRGISADVLRELAKRTGCRFEPVWYPRGRLFVEFDNGRVDMTLGAVRTPARDRIGRLMPYSITHFVLLLSNKVPGSYASLADFVEHSTARLNVTRGIDYPPAVVAQFERLRQSGRLEYVNDYDVVFRKLQAGRADGTFSTPGIHLLYLRRLGITRQMHSFVVREAPRRVIGAYIASSVPAEATGLYAGALRAMVDDGTVYQIYVRNIGLEATRQLFDDSVRVSLDAVAATGQ